MTAPTRISAARLAEIEQVTERVLGQTYREPIYPALTELLAELREVTRERDEALEHLRESSDKDLQKFLYAGAEYLKLEQERDRLAAEVERLHEKYDLQLLVKREDALRAEVERLKEAGRTLVANTFSKSDEMDALRVENAKLKAVADAARPTCERYRQFDKTVKPEIEVLEATLAALDGRDEKGKGV